jgi:hypothetical protein
MGVNVLFCGFRDGMWLGWLLEVDAMGLTYTS